MKQYIVDGDDLKSLAYAFGTSSNRLIHHLWMGLNNLSEDRLPYVDATDIAVVAATLGENHPLVIELKQNLELDNSSTV